MNDQPWRSHLKPAETLRVLELDQTIETARRLDSDATAERELIRRRATQRMKKANAGV
jgi:vacuolar-type H+-ATPase subunit H